MANQDQPAREKLNASQLEFSDLFQRIANGEKLSQGESSDLPDHEREELARRFQAEGAFSAMAGERAADYRFVNYGTYNEPQRKALAAVKEWADEFSSHPQEPLILYGPVGTGKDHLAFAAARKVLIKHGGTACFMNGRSLFAKMRDCIGDDKREGDVLDSLIRPTLLLLSDPQPPIGELTSFQADTLYRLIDERYRRKRITLVTINAMNDDEASDAIGAASWDRMCEDSWKIFCNWKSHRKPARMINA